MKPKTPFNAFFILFILSGLSTFPQQKLDLPYNYLWHLTKKEYAHYIRKSQLNVNELKFDGKVEDYNNAGLLLMEGYFKNNMRNGSFKFYFSDGRLKCEGNYKNNLRDSIWNFYNERGELYQVVDFTNKDFIVHKYINEDGKNMVQNGTGKWTTTFENEYTKEIDGMMGEYRGSR